RGPVVDLRDRQIRGHVAELVHAAGDRHHLPRHEGEQAEGHQRCRELEPSHHRWPRKLVDHVHYQMLLAQEHRRHAEENGAGEPELDQLEHAAHRIAEDRAQHHGRQERGRHVAEDPGGQFQKLREVLEYLCESDWISLNADRAGRLFASSSFSLASVTSAPTLRKRSFSALESLIGCAPPSTSSFLPTSSSASQPAPTSFSTPTT